MDTLMWETKAASGRSAELADWIRSEALPALRERPEVKRVEVFASDTVAGIDDERIVVIVIASPGKRETELPAPPPSLVARPPHAWWFRRMDLL
ncbi:hypothetical protein [Amycolatopsis keratiniphila]|nr:hypothetical protein [Amycolatopsis keratiniphila]